MFLLLENFVCVFVCNFTTSRKLYEFAFAILVGLFITREKFRPK